ncbi:MAG: serine hydrolase [Polyangiaceae bacterium]|nr:serine hydrolase [Polyangiaceae bacterium]MCW5790739.1 serine hydrolase [Polyangiaceae bacterium]
MTSLSQVLDSTSCRALSQELGAIAREELLPASPGGVLAAARRASVTAPWEIGAAAVGQLALDDATPVGLDTLYDLASVTKPFVACAALSLTRGDPALLRTPLGALLPAAIGTPSEPTPLEALLCHRAGLEAHRPLYEPLTRGSPVDREASLRIAAEAIGSEEVSPPALYSDLGYLLAGAALERRSGLPLAELLEQVLTPWELGGTCCAAAELTQGGRHAARQVAPTEDVAWRGGRVWRVVHDENAFALGGLGVCGHAGLFGDVQGVLGFGRSLLEELTTPGVGRLPAGALRAALEPRAGGSYLLGFDGRSPEGSSAGTRFSLASFGHLGFTGTSLWCDPEAQVVVVVLSNRVCPTRDNPRLRAARPRIHDRVHRLLVG